MTENILRAFGVSGGLSGAMVDGGIRSSGGGEFAVHSPIDGRTLGVIKGAGSGDVSAVIDAAEGAFRTWRNVPAPRRGEFVRRIGERLRQNKKQLGEVVSWEVGKITAEAEGEVQEMIDICDFAV